MNCKIFVSTDEIKLSPAAPPVFVKNETAENNVVNIYSELRYQSVLGFGSALTDSSALCYGRMSAKTKREFINACFDNDKGLGYNFCRLHINSCDFSSEFYTYTDEGDDKLESFDISRDEKNIIPLLKAARRKNSGLKLYASPWSPPGWMKDTGIMEHGGKLLRRHYPTWAKYIVKYILEYKARGIDIFGLTVQNESMAAQTWESCEYSSAEQVIFVRDYLAAELQNAGLGEVKVMIWDHNKERVYDWTRDMLKIPGGSECIWGVAFHWYSGTHFDGLRFAYEAAPDKHFVASEFCFGGLREPNGGSKYYATWEQALKYAADMTGNFNNYMCASTDWNIMLDETGGPYHARGGGCMAPVQYDTRTDSFKLCDTYWAAAHFSKFVKRGAVRLGTTKWNESILVCAFENPDKSIVAIVTNTADKPLPVVLRMGDTAAEYIAPEKSITTIIIKGVRS